MKSEKLNLSSCVGEQGWRPDLMVDVIRSGQATEAQLIIYGGRWHDIFGEYHVMPLNVTIRYIL